LFQLVNVQRFALVTVVEIIADQPAVGLVYVDGVWTSKLCAVGEQRNKCFVVCTRVIVWDFVRSLEAGVS
jgi:hypothetical protein